MMDSLVSVPECSDLRALALTRVPRPKLWHWHGPDAVAFTCTSNSTGIGLKNPLLYWYL